MIFLNLILVDFQILKLNFTKFDVEIPRRIAIGECPYDNLTIYDGQDTAAPPIGVFCGVLGSGMAPPPIIYSAGNSVRLRFKTDRSESREVSKILKF